MLKNFIIHPSNDEKKTRRNIGFMLHGTF